MFYQYSITLMSQWSSFCVNYINWALQNTSDSSKQIRRFFIFSWNSSGRTFFLIPYESTAGTAPNNQFLVYSNWRNRTNQSAARGSRRRITANWRKCVITPSCLLISMKCAVQFVLIASVFTAEVKFYLLPITSFFLYHQML